MKTGFKKYDSSYKRKESPFTRIGGMGISNIPSQNLTDDQKDRSKLPLSRSKERKKADAEKILARAKGQLIKRAERKESKAAKRREQGREVSAARKTRKATKLRKRADELKADKFYGMQPGPFKSKKLLKKVSSQLKAASKKHAGQAAKIDKATSAMKSKHGSKLKRKKTLVGPNDKLKKFRSQGGAAAPMKKISGPCKAAAKRKFKVWPSAYASGWGVRCTKAGGPSKFGG
jgi:hypothetical protein